MPWSPWITPAPVQWSNPLVKYSRNRSVGQVFGPDLAADVSAAYADAAAGTGTFWETQVLDRFTGRPTGYRAGIDTGTSPAESGDGSASLEQIVYWYAKPDDSDYTGQRDWFPPVLWPLTEGVDYAGRPDRTPADQDYYVEYQTGVDSQFAGWTAQAIIGWQTDSPTGTASGRIAFATNPPPPEVPPIFGATTAATPQLEPQSGPSILSVTGGATASRDFSADLDGLTEFGIVALTDAEPPPDADWTMSAPEFTVRTLLQYPPFRYWIPGDETYLWNVRSDGLGQNNLWNLPKTRQSTAWNQAPR